MFLIYLWEKGGNVKYMLYIFFQIRQFQKCPTAFIQTEEFVRFVTF